MFLLLGFQVNYSAEFCTFALWQKNDQYIIVMLSLL